MKDVKMLELVGSEGRGRETVVEARRVPWQEYS